MSSAAVVQRFRLFFTYAIDLGHLLEDQKEVHALQSLRAKDGLNAKLVDLFDNTHATASAFNNPHLEADALRSRAYAALKHNGKAIWSDLFLRQHAPILFSGSPLCDSPIPIAVAEEVSIAGVPQGIRFKECEFRIFRNGTLCFTYAFMRDSTSLEMGVDQLIDAIEYLAEQTYAGYIHTVKEIVTSWSKSKVALVAGQPLRFTPVDQNADAKVRAGTVKHSCLFLEGFKENGARLAITDSTTKRVLLGVLNRAAWYEKYGDDYLDQAFGKNVGYRNDEVYLTDKDASLVLLADFWTTPSLNYYSYDLVLSIGLQISRFAHLTFMLQYMQDNPDSRKALQDLGSDRAVDLVLEARGVMTLVHEAGEVDSLVLHGFTRRFMKQLGEERNIAGIVKSIERRIENINNAIDLKSAVDLGKHSAFTDRRAVKWAIIAVIVSAALSLTQVLLDHIVPRLRAEATPIVDTVVPAQAPATPKKQGLKPVDK